MTLYCVQTPADGSHDIAAADPVEAVRAIADKLNVPVPHTPRKGQTDLPRWRVGWAGAVCGPCWIFVSLQGVVE